MIDDQDSPCVGYCSTALGDMVCRGCGRTFGEVSSWLTLSPHEKARSRERLGRRLSYQALADALGAGLAMCEQDGEEWAALTLFDAEPLLCLIRPEGKGLRLRLRGQGRERTVLLPARVSVPVLADCLLDML